MRKYYVIKTEEFKDEMLVDNYDVVNKDRENWVVVIDSNGATPPEGDWIVFDGEKSNIDCAGFLNNQ